MTKRSGDSTRPLKGFGPNSRDARSRRSASGLRAIARPLLAGSKYLLPIVLLAVLAGGIFYVRLINGPISLRVLAEPIARSIAAEMPELGVSIEDALVRLNDDGQLEFRLRNVRLLDQQGGAVAIAPLAAIELSRDALWAGRLSPAKVVLIEPRLLLTYSAEDGLAVSFARPAEATPSQGVPEQAARQPSEPGQAYEAGLPVALRQLDLARTIADAAARARRGADASSFLRELGLRNAVLIFEHGGGQTLWHVPQADIALSHRKTRSIIEGVLTVASTKGPWGLEFWTEASESTQHVSLKADFHDLVPSSLSGALPGLAPLQALDLPASGKVSLDLTSAGKVTGGAFSLELSRGVLRPPWLASRPMEVEGGRLDLRYDPVGRRLRVAPSTLVWGQSRMTIEGQVVSSVGADGTESWAFDLAGLEGRLAAEEFGIEPVPLEGWLAQGTLRPETGALTIKQYVMQAGGGRLRLSGSIGSIEEGATVNLAGEIGPMPLATLETLWPRAIAPATRLWVGHNLTDGRVLGGSFRWQTGPKEAGSPDQQRLSLALEASDLRVRPLTGLPPVEVPRALVRLEGPGLEIAMPDASITLSQGRRINLKSGRFTVADTQTENPVGQIAFRGQASAAAALELLEQEAFSPIRLAGLRSDSVEGKVDGHLAITLPLKSAATVADLKVEGRGKLTEGRARQLLGNRDAQAASIVFDVSERAIEARGDMLVSGVPVKIGWQHIFDAPLEKQPPLRLTATLDSADRAQLGIDATSIFQGEVPVEVTVTRAAEQDHEIHVRADLTRADMILENVAWRKPPGRAATLQFDVVAAGRHRTELQNFRIVGDDIAINGWMAIDADNKIREFRFPEFSVSVVTRLEIHGGLRGDNVWEVNARGQTYDGRDVFRALFSLGELTEKPADPRKDVPGVDLKAEIDTVIGYSDVALRGFSMQLARRGGRLTQLAARGILDGGRPLEIGLHQVPGEPRRLVATTDDAGQAFRLVDFYPSLQAGRMRLEVNLDGRGPAEKTGVLRVDRFRILGDPVVNEVLQFPDESRGYVDPQRTQRVVRQAFDFDWMRIPFSVGHGQFVMGDSEIRGPLVGATLRGKADFRTRYVNVGGTYVPLQGLNSAIGAIPGLGQLLAGPRGEGVLGITFAIQGPMAQPQVLVNPLSLVAPGIFREMFQLTPSQSVTPPRNAPAPGAGQRSSTAPAASASGGQAGRSEPDVLTGWSSETSPGAAAGRR